MAPRLFIGGGDRDGIDAIRATLERGFNGHDADLADSVVADDVLWGSPKGQVVTGLATLNPIHHRLKAQGGFGHRSRYRIETLEFLAPDIACAHVRRTGLDESGQPIDPAGVPDRIVQEMALYLLVRREGRWWIAAAQNTPVRW